eukprot:4042871-Amphidinium_carterae.1
MVVKVKRYLRGREAQHTGWMLDLGIFISCCFDIRQACGGDMMSSHKFKKLMIMLVGSATPFAAFNHSLSGCGRPRQLNDA